MQEEDMEALSGFRIAFLVDDGFQQLELAGCAEELLDAGGEIEIIAPLAGRVRATNLGRPGMKFSVDRTIDEVKLDDFDALVVPGGAASVEKLRGESRARDFVRAFIEAGKPVGAIGLGPALLLEAGVVAGKLIAASVDLHEALDAAGANVTEERTAFDGIIVTAASADDVPGFATMFVELIAGGRWKRPGAGAQPKPRPRGQRPRETR
jgi:protease I